MARTNHDGNQDRSTVLIPVISIAVLALALIGWRVFASDESSDDPAPTPSSTASATAESSAPDTIPSVEAIKNAPLAVPASCASLHSEVFAETHGDTMNVAFADGQFQRTDVFEPGVMEIVSVSDTTIVSDTATGGEPVIGVVIRCNGPYGPVDSFVLYDANLHYQHALEPFWDEDFDVLGGANPEFFSMNDAVISGSDITFVARGLVPAEQPEVGGVGEANAYYTYDPANTAEPFQRVVFDIFYSDEAQAAIDEAARVQASRGGVPAVVPDRATEAVAALIAATPVDLSGFNVLFSAHFTTPSTNWTCTMAASHVTCTATGAAPIPTGEADVEGEGEPNSVIIGRDGPAFLISVADADLPDGPEVLAYGERIDRGMFACSVDETLGVICALTPDYSHGFQVASTKLTVW